ncbi:MAG: histidine phosphatase family protein [archaeon]|nr:histidine phosphatase family protein [archaeon]MCR4323455.1 histidine phosphatase family protein [Nanoarchaeota archaeon]
MKKKRLKIYLFRHGETTYNRDGRFTGHLDAKLTAKGKRQALGFAKTLKRKKFQVAIRTSLSRSKDTLAPVLKDHPECVLVIEDNRMIERSYGDLEGITHDQFKKRIGKQEYDLEVEGDAIENLEPKLRKKVEEFLGNEEYKAIHRGFDVAPPNGESFKDVEKRVRKFIKDLKKFMKKNKVSVVISAHGNSIRLFRKVAEGASVEETVKWFIPYDKIFTYEV